MLSHFWKQTMLLIAPTLANRWKLKQYNHFTLQNIFAHPFWGANGLKRSLWNEWKSFLLFFLYMKSYNKMVYPPNLYALLYNSFPPFWGKLIIIIWTFANFGVRWKLGVQIILTRPFWRTNLLKCWAANFGESSLSDFKNADYALLNVQKPAQN